MKSGVRIALSIAMLAGVWAVPASAERAPYEGTPTFAKHVSPLLQRSCVGCHRPGSIAPMSLITYDQVRPWARAIRERVSRSPSDPERMPPWFIEKNVGIQRFKDDPSLSDGEIALIDAWVDGGAPRGDPADLPPARDWSDGGWSIGTPDLIVSSPAVSVEAVAADQNIQLAASPTGLAGDRYVKAVEIKEVRPGEQQMERIAGRAKGDLNYFVLHHAVITGAPLRDGEAADGFSFDPGAFRIVHELGQNATIFPDGIGVLLPGNSALTWDVHTHSVGKPVVLRIDVGFKFHPPGYEPKYRQSAGSVSMTLASQSDLDIPAGEGEVMVDGYYVMPRPSKMLTFEPHLHSSGKRMCAEAIYPNGYREVLNCAGYNHNWVKIYNYEDDAAPLLPEDTIIHMIAWYDNTVTNPRVVDPRNWKGFGSRSIDDMSLMLPRVLYLTDEEFAAEVAERTAQAGWPGAPAHLQHPRRPPANR